MRLLSIGEAKYDISLPIDDFPIENGNYKINEKIECGGGSATTVAYMFGKWQEESYFSGVIGYDDFGNAIKKELEEVRVNTTFIETSYEKKTTSAFAIINKKNHSRTVFDIVSDIPKLKKYEYSILPDVFFTDGFEYSASVEVFNKFPRAISVIDATEPTKEFAALCKYAKYIVASERFANGFNGVKIDYNNPQSLMTAYKKLKDYFPNNQVIIRLGEYGALYQVGDEVRVMPGLKIEVIDTTGAGAIFSGSFLFALGRGYDIEKSVRFANIAAGLSVGKMGVKDSIPLLSDVMAYYEKSTGESLITSRQNGDSVVPSSMQSAEVNTNSVQKEQILTDPLGNPLASNSIENVSPSSNEAQVQNAASETEKIDPFGNTPSV